MDSDLVILVGIPVVCAFTARCFKAWLQYKEKRDLILSSRVPQVTDDKTFAELRNEIIHVRAVSNEYDLSIQHTLDEIVRRLEYLEAKSTANVPIPRPAPPAPQEEQITINGSATRI
jgi:hypothetical protein